LWGRAEERNSGQTEKPAATQATPAAPQEKPAATAAKAEAAAACTDCHEDQGKSFPGNPHNRIPAAMGKDAGAACVACHGVGTKHMESSGEDKSDIRVFKGRAGAEFCVSCHVSDQIHASYKAGIHASTETVNCVSCHSVHTPEPKTPHLLVKTPTALCETCHPAQAASFKKPYAHRLGRGGMECSTCHDPHGKPIDKGLRLTRAGEMPCLTCHAEKRGPFVFEHVNNVVGTCTSCHEPHGSSNPKRLIRAQVQFLCLECHSTLTPGVIGSQPPSIHDLTQARWRNCTVCHTAVHGSNLSPQLFK
jgi:DmsE family decaheme c-type cytochrome